MYQVTYIVGSRLQTISTPCYATARVLRHTLPTKSAPRLWQFVAKGKPVLVK